MQVNACIMSGWPRMTRCSRRWPIRPGGRCLTGCANATGRPSGSCVSRSTWRGSRRPSTWACWRRPTSSPPSAGAGTVLESLPPRRLAMTFDAPGAAPPQGPSRVTFDIEPHHEIVRLTVTHENLADESALEAASAGWPAVLANLKSLLETGHELPRAPWEMPPELRAGQL